jgi:5-dehydro-4-deoxyglucarate dehydratase
MIPLLSGLLFFPVTPFRTGGGIDRSALEQHVRRGVEAGAGAVFVACGTGEFHALNPSEYEEVVSTAVSAVAGSVPVYAGVGGAIATAIDLARSAKTLGVDGLLLLPPYLVQGPLSGLVGYVTEVAAATDLPVIVYQRGSAVFTPAAAAEVAVLPTVVGFKDGVGDLVLLADIISAIRQVTHGVPFQFFNGMPTAELSQATYRKIGVELYSSAVFAFSPEIALTYHRASSDGDEETVATLLRDFYQPFGRLRDRVPGYPVSLVKAGVGLRGFDMGGVRPPLVDPTPEDLVELQDLLDKGLASVSEMTFAAVGRSTRP